MQKAWFESVYENKRGGGQGKGGKEKEEGGREKKVPDSKLKTGWYSYVKC